jgi:hypothetical protein
LNAQYWNGQTYITPTAFTPFVWQGDYVAFGALKATYSQIVKRAHLSMVLVVSGVGYAGNQIQVDISYVPAGIRPAQGEVIGSFQLMDAGSVFYVGSVVAQDPTTLVFQTNGVGSRLGLNPSFVLAANDWICINADYDAP